MPKEYRVIGTSPPRHESFLKVTGGAQYTDDISIPGMVFGKILRSPHAHARVVRIDTTEALRMPGVLGILTYKDVPATLYNCSGTPPSAMIIKDERILTAEPKHVGDKIAAVVAGNENTCAEALAKIKVEYELLPPVFEIEEALVEGAPLIHSNICQDNICKTLIVSQGDIEQGFQESEHVFERTYKTPAIQHVPLEPTGCICHYTIDERLKIWATSQTPHHERRLLSDLTGIPQSRIRIVKPVMGGGFGARQQLHHQPVGVFLSKMVRRPVKMIYDREEEMYASAVRHGSLIKVRAGVNNDGKLVAFQAQVYLNTGGYITHGPIVLAAMSKKMQYKVPNYRFEGHCIYTNAPVAGAMRGYGNPQLNFARETLFNELCLHLGWDPLEFRVKNHIQVGDRVPGMQEKIESCEISACLDAAKRIKGDLENGKKLDVSSPHKSISKVKKAWGVSFGCHGSGIVDRDQSSAVVLVNDDGTVNLLVGAPDIGQGSDTILAQIAAEELGLDSGQVLTVSADTEHVPYDNGAFSSRQAYVVGNAVLQAARDVKVDLQERLSSIYEVNKESVKFLNQQFVINTSTGDVHLSFTDAVRKASFGATGKVFIGRASFKPASSPPPYAVCFAEVEVDNDTGKIRVPNIIMTVDVGKPINPEIVRGQVEGGVSMGVGFALSEMVQIDFRLKKPLETNLLYYKVQFTVDSPDIHTWIADGYEPSGPYGAKSVGELPAVPVAAAIIHAIYKATGVWVRDLPLTYNLKGGKRPGIKNPTRDLKE